MSAIIDTLPALPPALAQTEQFTVFGTISPPDKRSVEPIGPGFLAHARRTLKGRTWSEDEKIQAQQNVKKTEETDGQDEDDEPEDREDLQRDPKDWKEQDHYRVLGLSKYRYKATPEQIRNAHRRRVLKHHPDKKAAQGALNQDGFFKCIQKAFEVLIDPVKRAQFDSVDEEADVPPPTGKLSAEEFISEWGPVFASEARFSNKTPVPLLGTMDTPKAEVDAFYSFWYNFDSWRTFEYLDEDVPDDTSNRDNKRYVEKKNKAARQKRKTEDSARLRKLVDDALAQDPRIKMFKDAERKAKEQRKWERDAGARAEAEAKKKAAEEAEKKRIEEEAKAKAAREDSKKSKEAAKNAKKKNKRAIRGSVKDVNYFAGAGADASSDQITNVLLDVDAIIDKLDDMQLQTLATKVDGQKDAEAVSAAFKEAGAELKDAGKLSALKFF